MNNKVHNQIVSFIWSIADDVLRDKVGGKSKYRDYILPFVVLRRVDALLVETKEKVLEQNKFMDDNRAGIDRKQKNQVQISKEIAVLVAYKESLIHSAVLGKINVE